MPSELLGQQKQKHKGNPETKGPSCPTDAFSPMVPCVNSAEPPTSPSALWRPPWRAESGHTHTPGCAAKRAGVPGLDRAPARRYCCTGLIGATVISHFLFNKLLVGVFSPCSYWIVVFSLLILGSFFYILDMHLLSNMCVSQISFPKSWPVWSFPLLFLLMNSNFNEQK